MPVLTLIRGAPGSGKSTLAKAIVANDPLHTVHLEADMFHTDKDGNYNWKPENVVKGHEWCREQVEMRMMVGTNVVVCNTFTTEKELDWYYGLAADYDYIVQEIVMRYPVFKNVHGVPEGKVVQYQERLEASLR